MLVPSVQYNVYTYLLGTHLVCSEVVKLAEITAMLDRRVSPRLGVVPWAPLKSAMVRSLMEPLDLGSSIANGR